MITLFEIKNYIKVNYQLILQKLLNIIIIIGCAIIIYQVLRLIVRRIFSISFKRIHFKGEVIIKKRQRTLEKIILSLLKYFFYFVTFLIILASLGININTILTGAGILGVVFAVGSQNLVKDFIEGFFNVFEDNISVGDYVLIDDCEGTIIDIGLRSIKIKSYSGEIHIIPNSLIGHVVNYSLDEGKVIVDLILDYKTNYQDLLPVLNTILSELKKKNENILTTPKVLGISKLYPNYYEVRITCETKKESHWQVARFIREEIFKTLNEHQIPLGIRYSLLTLNNQKE